MRRNPICLLSVAATLCACGGSGEPVITPSNAPYVATLVSPLGAEGSAIVSVDATTDSVTLNGGRAFSQSAAGITRIVMILDQPGEMRFTLHGVRAGSGRIFQVLQVADTTDRPRASLTDYRVQEAK